MQHPIKPTIVAIQPTTKLTLGCLETIKMLALAGRAFKFPK
jgi:hypothetical protein